MPQLDGGAATSIPGTSGTPTPGFPTPLTVAQFMLWTKRYGFQTAVLLLLAHSVGAFDTLTSTLGGMC